MNWDAIKCNEDKLTENHFDALGPIPNDTHLSTTRIDNGRTRNWRELGMSLTLGVPPMGREWHDVILAKFDLRFEKKYQLNHKDILHVSRQHLQSLAVIWSLAYEY